MHLIKLMTNLLILQRRITMANKIYTIIQSLSLSVSYYHVKYYQLSGKRTQTNNNIISSSS